MFFGESCVTGINVDLKWGFDFSEVSVVSDVCCFGGVDSVLDFLCLDVVSLLCS